MRVLNREESERGERREERGEKRGQALAPGRDCHGCSPARGLFRRSRGVFLSTEKGERERDRESFIRKHSVQISLLQISR